MFDIIQLNEKLLPELKELAKKLKIEAFENLKKQDLVYKILDHQALHPDIDYAGLGIDAPAKVESSKPVKAKKTAPAKEETEVKKPRAVKEEKSEVAAEKTSASAPAQVRTQPDNNDGRPKRQRIIPGKPEGEERVVAPVRQEAPKVVTESAPVAAPAVVENTTPAPTQEVKEPAPARSANENQKPAYPQREFQNRRPVQNQEPAFDFGGNVDETKFSTKANRYVNNLWSTTTNTSRAISGLGKVDITNDLDTAKVSGGGVKATTTAGQVEWAIINPYNATLGGHQLLIDEREFDGTGVSPNDITSIKLFDIYDGPVSVNSVSGWWKTYVMPGNLTSKITSSTFQAQLRLQDGWYGTRAEFSFSPIMAFKQHGIDLSYTNQNDLNTLYNSVVTVSDVFIAFKELANGGLFGNESGNEFTSGIQYMNADVDGNGIFNEADTYRLLQHLTGAQPLTQYSALTYLMKLYSKSDYDGITKSNWNTKFNSTRSLFPFSLNTGTLNNTYNVNVTWLGDVNLSHSAQQSTSGVTGNSIRTMSLSTNSVPNQINAYLMGENVDNKVIVTISLDPLQQEVVGTQFQLNYDNSVLKFEKVEFTTKGNPMNYGTNKDNYINLGSLITDGSTTLDKTTEYKIIFTPLAQINSILGLTSISNTDAVNKNGKSLKIKIN